MADKNDETNRPDDLRDEEPQHGEAVTQFGQIRMTSSFDIVEMGPGQLGFSIQGPFLEFLDSEAQEDESQEDTSDG